MASSDLKRVGLVFQADGTVDFKKSLKEINNELSSNYQQLKLTQSQYDKNTTTTQKLQDKYDSMNRTIDLQKEKVKLLNEELLALESAENKDETAIQKKKKALTDAEIKLNNYNKQLNATEEELKKNTSLLEKFSESAQKSSEKLEKVGKITSIAGGALTAAGTVAVNSMNKVDEGLDTIVQKTGATGDTLDGLTSNFKNVASTIPEEFSDIGAALGEINTRLDLSGEKLENCAEDFLKFARVNGTDVNTSIQLITRAMGDAEISADNYKEVLDMLTIAGQKSGISIDSLSTNLAKYGAPMRALGIDTKNAIAMFAGWEKAGVNTEIAFSGMRQAISKWGAQGKDATKEFSKTLEEIKKAPTLVEANNIAFETFGKKAGTDLADAIRAGRFSFEEYVTTLESSEGIIESTYSNLVDEVDDAKLAHQNLDLTLHGLGESISKFIGPILLNLAKWFSNIMAKFDNLDPKIKDIILKISSFVIIAGPVLLILSKVVGSITGLISGIKKLKSGFDKISPIIKKVTGLLNTKRIIIGLIIAAVVLLVATIIKNWDKIKTATKNFVESVKNFFISLGQTIGKVWQHVISGLQNVYKFFVSIFQGIDDFFSNIFLVDFSEKFGLFGEVLNMAIANFKNMYESFKQILSGIIDFVAGIFTGDWSRAWQGIKNIFSGIFNGLLSIAKVPLNGIIGLLNMMIDAVNFLINGINKISVDIPDWVPKWGGKKFGFNLPTIGKIAYLAKGGELLRGSAIVAEAGPEMLMQEGNKTKVLPLTNQSRTNTNIIDYEKLFKMFLKALNTCKLKLDRDGWIKFINDQIWEAIK